MCTLVSQFVSLLSQMSIWHKIVKLSPGKTSHLMVIKTIYWAIGWLVIDVDTHTQSEHNLG